MGGRRSNPKSKAKSAVMQRKYRQQTQKDRKREEKKRGPPSDPYHSATALVYLLNASCSRVENQVYA